MILNRNDIILFQGDSITDAGRLREVEHDLGRGYAYLVSAWLNYQFPELKLRFINRGISGNRAVQLEARWERDCLALQPTVVSIYIGINDTWRKYDRNDPTTPEAFEASYRSLLDRTRERLEARILLLEPFVLPTSEDRNNWREDLDPKIHVVRKLAREYETILIPLDGLFAQASASAACDYWAEDGVHPTPAGHALIAEAWLRAVGAR